MSDNIQNTAEIIQKGATTYLHHKGFIHLRHSRGSGNTVYWQCNLLNQCPGRLTTECVGNTVRVRKEKSHSHTPNPEEVKSLRLLANIKRTAAEQPEAPPARIMRCLQEATPAVLAQLPDRTNIRKQIQRSRLKELPSNPQSIAALREIPDVYRKTLVGENFLLYDSYEDENYDLECGRIIMFCTQENLRLLFRSQTWFVDGTFSTVPSIFFQLFAILGSRTQVYKGVEQVIALPLVYVLLEGKEQVANSKIFEILNSSGSALEYRFGILHE